MYKVSIDGEKGVYFAQGGVDAILLAMRCGASGIEVLPMRAWAPLAGSSLLPLGLCRFVVLPVSKPN